MEWLALIVVVVVVVIIPVLVRSSRDTQRNKGWAGLMQASWRSLDAGDIEDACAFYNRARQVSDDWIYGGNQIREDVQALTWPLLWELAEAIAAKQGMPPPKPTSGLPASEAPPELPATSPGAGEGHAPSRREALDNRRSHTAAAPLARPDALDTLTTGLAERLGGLRETFYACSVAVLFGYEGQYPEPPSVLSADGHFVIASFQLWHMFGLLGSKAGEYVPPHLAREYADQMFAKVALPFLPNGASLEDAAKGVRWFMELSKGNEADFREEFWHRLKEIIFDGHCDLTGYRRSLLSLGVDVDPADLIGMRVEIDYFIAWLTVQTQLAVAEAFGDGALAAEKRHALDELASRSE